MTLCRLLRSLSEKSISLCKLCGSRCLCGGIAKENAHHRGTEIAQRTTETNSPTDSFAGLLNRAVGNLQSLVDDREGFAHFCFGDTQRRIGEEGIPTHERVETFLTEIFSERLHLRRGAIERRQRLERLMISHQLDDAKETQVARRSHGRMTSLQIFEQAAHHHAQVTRSLDQIIFFIHCDGG